MVERRSGISPLVLLFACALALALGWWLGFARARTASPAPAASNATAQLWTCGMHPQVIQDHPGTCPICQMELTPLAAGTSANAHLVEIDPVVVQNMGVRVETVRRAPLVKSARFAGNVMEPENARVDVVVRVAGWVRKLEADTTGMEIARDGVLFELDSPELAAAVEELLAAARGQTEAKTESGRTAAANVHQAARRRLSALGLSAAQIDGYEQSGRAPELFAFTTPFAAHVLEKEVREGMRVESGMKLLTLSNRARMWIDFAVPEADLAWLRAGARASARVPARGSHVLNGTVSLLLPHLDEMTRTARARLEVENPDMQLREGMSAEVSASARIEESPLVVPREAVIDTGTRRVAFVALGAGRFEARDLELGPEGDQGVVAVHEGLSEGEPVVVSGQFLLDAESRIRESIRRHLAGAPPPGSSSKTPRPPRPALEGPLQQRTDEFFRQYLALAERLGGSGVDAERFDPAPLVEASRVLEGDAQSEAQRIARAITLQALALQKQNGTERRRTFAALSELVIQLCERQPPSRAVAPRLYIARCTMAPGSWLQTGETIANPFYADRMKTCGEIQGSIEAAEER